MQQNDTQKPGADHTPAIEAAALAMYGKLADRYRDFVAVGVEAAAPILLATVSELEQDLDETQRTLAIVTQDRDARLAELERQRDEARAEATTLRGERNWLLADLDAEGRHRFHLLAQTAERSRAERVLPASVGHTFGDALAEMGSRRARRPNPPGPIELHDCRADGGEPCDDCKAMIQDNFQERAYENGDM